MLKMYVKFAKIFFHIGFIFFPYTHKKGIYNRACSRYNETKECLCVFYW